MAASDLRIPALGLASMMLATACGARLETRPAELVANEMPTGGSWDGVYRGPDVGQLHLVSHGTRVRGAWRTMEEHAHGELSGEVRGNVLTYEWTEREVARVGGAVRQGTGYLVYVVEQPGAIHELLGERTTNRGGALDVWRARKWDVIEPDLWNVRPGGSPDDGEESDGDYYLDTDEEG